eukprot:CAMPEP_0201530492 /NCGR_PEP_ID=MMETSP0161_2-20130828/44854_1 /ASSEMBLY_ACC=CAM_ASM_000251 /TAXON_ID=180227 /ORGANISM="Neoparamoeba aestuarina, Strain SoJaBio B1-5/56/2" /LENGTH=158 /DNA_ID=CAMNT_0047932881 /DNA_START=93 /DNA_END=572 /DNA_ORIENTATION=+
MSQPQPKADTAASLGLAQDGLQKEVDKQLTALVDNFRVIIASSAVSLYSEKEKSEREDDERFPKDQVRSVEADKCDLRITIATQNLISAGEKIFTLSHEMDKTGMVNDLPQRAAQLHARKVALAQKKKEVFTELVKLQRRASHSLHQLEAAYYSSQYR